MLDYSSVSKKYRRAELCVLYEERNSNMMLARDCHLGSLS